MQQKQWAKNFILMVFFKQAQLVFLSCYLPLEMKQVDSERETLVFELLFFNGRVGHFTNLSLNATKAFNQLNEIIIYSLYIKRFTVKNYVCGFDFYFFIIFYSYSNRQISYFCKSIEMLLVLQRQFLRW